MDKELMTGSPIKIDPEIMHGEPCFTGTRVTVKTLFDYLIHGHDLNYFLEGFPTVPRDLAVAVLEEAYRRVVGATP
ncbi:MAG: DUF433 domain-containing protein [Planctomycetota bacterium]